MSEKSDFYNQYIINTIGSIPEVCGTYDILSSKLLEIHPNDFNHFSKLFNVLINNNYGNGELALYWLLNKYGINFDERKNKDLIISNIPVEIKNYGKAKMVKIGKIPKTQIHNLVKLQHCITKINSNYLVSHLNKKLIHQILDLEFKYKLLIDEFKQICKEIIKESLIHKIGDNLGCLN